MDNRIMWLAPLHEHRQHSADWYWVVSIITIALAVSFFIAGDLLLSIIIVLGVGILLALSRHEPEVVEFEISKQGVRANKVLYPWQTLDTFWILDETPETGAKILITSKKILMPHIVIPLDINHQEEVHRILAHMLHEEHQMEPFPHRIMRKLGF